MEVPPKEKQTKGAEEETRRTEEEIARNQLIVALGKEPTAQVVLDYVAKTQMQLRELRDQVARMGKQEETAGEGGLKTPKVSPIKGVGRHPDLEKTRTEVLPLNTTVTNSNLDVQGVELHHDVAGNTQVVKVIGQPILLAPNQQRQVREVATSIHANCRLEVLQPVALRTNVAWERHGVIASSLVPIVIHSWLELFQCKQPEDVNRVVSAVCWFFANNSTSWRVPGDLTLTVMVDEGVPRRVTLAQIRQITYSVCQESSMRRVMRAFADFTRATLQCNTDLWPDVMKTLSLPEVARIIAFDYADYCQNPPLSTKENELVQKIKRFVLNQHRSYESQLPEPTLGSQPEEGEQGEE
jgi:hypothetical protein